MQSVTFLGNILGINPTLHLVGISLTQAVYSLAYFRKLSKQEYISVDRRPGQYVYSCHDWSDK